jgi:hypothetical protein
VLCSVTPVDKNDVKCSLKNGILEAYTMAIFVSDMFYCNTFICLYGCIKNMNLL